MSEYRATLIDKLLALPNDIIMPVLITLCHLDPDIEQLEPVQAWVQTLSAEEAAMMSMLLTVAQESFETQPLPEASNEG